MNGVSFCGKGTTGFRLDSFNVHLCLSEKRREEAKRGRETKGMTESEGDVICLQSIGCTYDHTWDHCIICFHLPAFPFFLSNSFSTFFFSFNSHSIKAGCNGWELVNCLGALCGDQQTLTRWLGQPHIVYMYSSLWISLCTYSMYSHVQLWGVL